MAYLLGSSDTTRFSSSYSLTGNDFRSHYTYPTLDGISASAGGVAATLSLYINDWLSCANLKASLYENDALVESVIIPASAGIGLISVPLAGTTTITTGATKYRLSLYRDSGQTISVRSDSGTLLPLRYDSVTGSYTTPPATLPNGLFDSYNEYYWAIESASGPTVDTITDPIIGTNPVTIVLSEAAPTVDTITFTVGTVTQSQSYTTEDDTTFTISAVTRDLLPPIGTVTVELKAGASVIASTTSTLQQAAGYSAVTGSGVVDANCLPHTGFLDNGDIALSTDNITVSPDFTDATQTTREAGSIRIWDASEETWGDVVIYPASGGSSGSANNAGIGTGRTIWGGGFFA